MLLFSLDCSTFSLIRTLYCWVLSKEVLRVTYSYTCGNIVNIIKTNGHSSLEKYTSHFIRKGLRKGYERVIVWEVSWRRNKDSNILTTTFLALAVLLSRSPTAWLPVAPGLYHCLTSTCFLWRHNSHSIQPVDSQGYPLKYSTGCTCYLHRCISHLAAGPGRKSICYTSTIFKVFGMTRPEIEPRSPGPLVNTLPTWTMSRFSN